MNNPKVVAALQAQMNRERLNGAKYDALAGAFESMNLGGFARFMARNGDEERSHAKLFFDYLADLGELPVIEALPAVTPTFAGEVHADTLSHFQAAYAAEQRNKLDLEAVAGLADENGDQTTEAFLHPVLLGQQKSIREFSEIVTKLQIAAGNGAALLALDEQLGEGD